MKKSRSNQSGFGVLTILIVVLTATLVGFMAWFVYQHNRVQPTNAASIDQTTNHINNQSQQTANITPPTNQNVVKIPELGIQMTVPNEIKDLTYQVSTGKMKDGRDVTTALFSTTSLTAAAASCGMDFGPLGSLAKISGQYPTTFSESDPPINYGVLVKQFPTFFISSSGSQGACTTNSAALDSMSKFKADFLASLSTIDTLR